MALAKRYTVLVSDSAGNPLSTWLDVPALPALHLGPGGTTAVTITLQRPYGRLDEPGEPGGYGTLAWNNRLDVYVSGDRLAARAFNSPAVGSFVVGVSAIGVASGGPGQLVWSGTIEDVTPRPPDMVDVAVVSVERKLDEAVVPGTYAASGDALAAAKDVVINWCQTLAWDSANSVTSGQTVSGTYQNQTVRAILQSLANQAGTNYLLTVTPSRTVRLFQPDTSSATHTLIFGTHFVDTPQLGKIGNQRVEHVVLVYAGGYVEATAGGWTRAVGREAIYTDTSITDATTAQALANLLLAGRNLITLRAQNVIVMDALYDIDTINVGDTVNLNVPAAMTGLPLSSFGTTTIGQGGIIDYAQMALIVVGIDYNLTSVNLTLSEAVPQSELQILKLSQQLAAHLAQG